MYLGGALIAPLFLSVWNHSPFSGNTLSNSSLGHPHEISISSDPFIYAL